MSNTLQDIVFWNAHTDTRTHGQTKQKQFASGHTMLGGGIMRSASRQHLRLFNGSRVPITHWTDVHALVSLQVTLMEEFLHDTFSPLSVNVQRFSGVAQVGAVHEVL